MSTETNDLEQRVAELEKSLKAAFEWIATLGRQDATILQMQTWQISKLSGGKIPPPPGITNETYVDENKHILNNAITLNDFLLKVDSERAATKEERDE